MELLTNSDYDIVGLDGYGLTITGIRRITTEDA
jgi:GTP cyclohydrolase II